MPKDGDRPRLFAPECSCVPKRAWSALDSEPQSLTNTLSAAQYTPLILMFGLNEISARFEPEVDGSLGESWNASALRVEFTGSVCLPRRSVSPFDSSEPLMPDSGIE